MNINYVLSQNECCGCGLCCNICPVKAITMVEGKNGFLFPQIDEEKCINCGLCYKKCPQENSKSTNEKLLKCFVARSNINKIIRSSSSGGIIASIAKEFLKKTKGIIIGAAFDDNFKVYHKAINDETKIFEISGSKYVQSNMGNIYIYCKKELQNNKKILFIGTPCQVQALKNFIPFNDNLYTIDIICHGVGSPKFFEDYKKYISKKNKAKIKNINFRDKTIGYMCSRMNVKFSNKKDYYGSARTDIYLKCYFKSLISRDTCSNCKFKNIVHNSDLTCFDCWNFNKAVNSIKDDNLGYTNVLVNNTSGEFLMNLVKNSATLYETNISNILPHNGGMLLNNPKPNPIKREFWDYYNENGFYKTIKHYKLFPSIQDIVIENTKTILYKLNILDKLNSIISKRRRIKNGKKY